MLAVTKLGLKELILELSVLYQAKSRHLIGLLEQLEVIAEERIEEIWKSVICAVPPQG